MSADGEVLSKINANDLLDSGGTNLEEMIGDPVSVNYLKFLKDGLTKFNEA
jgi:hypothetical protein